MRPGVAQRRVAVALRYAALVTLAVLLLAPLAWLFISAIRPASEIFRHAGSFGLHTFLPDRLTLENFWGLEQIGFWRALLNSLFVASATMLLGIAINAAAGFAFAVFDFPLKRTLFALVLASSFMPFEAIVIPLYTMIRWLGWVDSYAALILPEIASGFVIFLFRQFFAGIPREFYEAARVDGAGWFRIFAKIALPLSWPVLVTAAMMLFILQWEAFFWPLVAAPSPDTAMVQIAIARNRSFEETAWGRLFSSTTIACVVAIIPFLIFQRFYLRSMVASGLK
jgi:ABC-type glycerol-3-phosphate transport system permease component